MRNLALASAFVLLPFNASADSLRCGDRIASDDSTQVEVVLRCGEPMAKSTRVEVISDSVQTGRKGTAVAQVRTVTRTIDEWTYNFGPSQFMQLVTFVDGRLRSVRSLSYGK